MVSSWVYVIIWISVSCAMIMFNKAVLDQMKFPFPMFLTTWHMFLSTILTQLLSRTTNLLPGVKEKKVDYTVIRNQILPVSIFFAFSLVFSNKAYLYLSVSYIQMLKAFTPVAVLIFSFFAGIEKTSMMEIYIVIVICIGVAVASAGELYFSWIGFTFQTLGIVFESSRLVLTNVVLKSLHLDPLSSLYYVAPLCCFFIGIAMLIFEFQDLPLQKMMTTEFCTVMIVNGMVAFSLNVAVVFLIKHTSALVLTLAGIAKDILLVVLSMTVFGSPVTSMQYAGYGVALLALNVHKEYKKNPERISNVIYYVCCCGKVGGSGPSKQNTRPTQNTVINTNSSNIAKV